MSKIMKFEQYADFAAAEWKRAMSESEHFSLEKCTDAEMTAVWDKMAPSYDLGVGSDFRRVGHAIERLAKLGAFDPDTIALDIGSGTGAYALKLADKCRTVYALDSSAGMLEILAEKVRRLGLNNVMTIQADWKTVNLDELPGRFDIVVSSLNTGIKDYETLVKMNSVSRGFCCYVAPQGRTYHSSRPDLQKIVFGRELRAAGGNDIIHPFNIIYGMGYRPELTYAPCQWSKEETPEEALEAVCREYGRYKTIDEALRERLRDYIMANLNERGLFTQFQKSTVGIMIWDTRLVQ